MAASEPPNYKNESESPWQPEEFATEMLDGHFTKPVVVAALVAKGVDREIARNIVTKLQKNRYLQVDLERKAAKRFQSRCLIALGAVLLLISIWLSFDSYGKAAKRPEGGGFVIYWGAHLHGLLHPALRFLEA